LPSSFTSIVNREWRSTRVAMCVLFEPLSKSPSQWPGIARSLTSAGRCRIETASTMRPRGWPSVLAFLEGAHHPHLTKVPISSF
jgi:hypothetical protein